jgi:cyanophycin synthetase
VRAAAEFTQAEVLLFALHHENPALRRHLEAGGRGVWVENGWVTFGTNAMPIHAFRLAEAHFTLDGALTFQVQNLLCAVALAYQLDVPIPALRRAVQHFMPGLARLPGSCNIVHLPKSTLVIDRARQLWTIRSLTRGIRHQPHRRMVTVAGCFPHLPEGQLVEMGRLLGRLGGAIILHAKPGDRHRVDQLIAGMTQNETVPLILSMPTEHEAIAHALKMLGPSDLGLIVTDDARAAMGSIRLLHA